MGPFKKLTSPATSHSKSLKWYNIKVMCYLFCNKICLVLYTGETLGAVLVFYLPICFFYYLANLIIFTRSSRFLVFFFLKGDSTAFI